MRGDFKADQYPGKTRILFVGLAESTHTHSWIDLLDGAGLNVRLFALPSGIPPPAWRVRTYVTAAVPSELDPATRRRLQPFPRLDPISRAARLTKRVIVRSLRGGPGLPDPEAWLADIVRRWRPHIIHTLGLDPAGFFFLRVRERFGLRGHGTWVLQLRGGSDLTLSHLDPEASPKVAEALRACDQLLSDNVKNFEIACSLGMSKDRIAKIGTVPGTGGVDVASLAGSWCGKPSERRVIVWPKAYECPWSKALPVFEAFRMCWSEIQPCRVFMLAVVPETRMWYWTLPEQLRQNCTLEERAPRERVLELMVRARVMLAPSLVDGTPNTMFEAMAAGAMPILSPLDTIRPIVENERNVLFARNLYPEEIASALVRAMSDDALVDGAAQHNLELIRHIADRAVVRPRVIEYYERLARRSGDRERPR